MHWQVTFDYLVDNESGSNRYRFSNEKDALDRWAECSQFVDEIMERYDNVEVVDEDDFYGRRDRDSGDYARALLTTCP